MEDGSLRWTARKRVISSQPIPRACSRWKPCWGATPDIHPEEQSALLDFLRKGPPLDTALLTAVDEIRPNLERFREDHRDAFELGPRHYLSALVILLIVLALCACLSDAGLQT